MIISNKIIYAYFYKVTDIALLACFIIFYFLIIYISVFTNGIVTEFQDKRHKLYSEALLILKQFLYTLRN